MESDVQVAVGGAEVAESRIERICDLYDRVFSAPPFFWRADESQLHRRRLVRLLADPSFGLTIAESRADVIGFAYGFTLPTNSGRWASLTVPVTREFSAEWPGRTFVLFDYAVAPDCRRKGIGRTLHDWLLGSRMEERATLTVQPTAVETKRIYEHWGWRPVGQTEGGQGAAAPIFDVYVRDRLDDLRSA